jgi:hypothetical protein
MPKKPAKLRPDVAETAFRVMREATGQAPKTLPPSERGEGERNPEAVARGRKGGAIGGKARAGKLSARMKKQQAKKAAKKRWEPRDAA